MKTLIACALILLTGQCIQRVISTQRKTKLGTTAELLLGGTVVYVMVSAVIYLLG